MDINEVLRALRVAVKDFERADTLHDEAESASHVVESFTSLDEWLSKGGFLPEDWARKGPSDAPLRRRVRNA